MEILVKSSIVFKIKKKAKNKKKFRNNFKKSEKK
jgi:hypothetical protein